MFIIFCVKGCQVSRLKRKTSPTGERGGVEDLDEKISVYLDKLPQILHNFAVPHKERTK
jgi:hypothetical protein